MIVAIFELHALSSLWLSSTSLLITFLPLNFLESPSFWSSSVLCNFCPSFISSSFGDSNLSPSGVFLPFFPGVIFLNITFVSSFLDGSFSCLGSSSCDLKYKSFNEGFDVSETTFSDTTLSASELVLSPGCLYSFNLSSSFGTDVSSIGSVVFSSTLTGSSLGSFRFFLSFFFLCFFFPFLDSSSGCFSSSSFGFSSGFISSFGFSSSLVTSSGNMVDSTLVTCWAFVSGNT